MSGDLERLTDRPVEIDGDTVGYQTLEASQFKHVKLDPQAGAGGRAGVTCPY